MCGIFGVAGVASDAARIVHTGLWALQHRGQESSGIATADGREIRVYKKEGLVSHVYDEEHLALLGGNLAIGHNRYSTSGGTSHLHAQPAVSNGRLTALVHNGNLPDDTKLTNFLVKKGLSAQLSGLNDSEKMQVAIEYFVAKGALIEEAVDKCMPLFTGTFGLLILTSDKLVAVRDRFGVRPLSFGKLTDGYAFSSETCALDNVRAEKIQDVAPGQMIVVGNNGLKKYQLAKGTQKLDVFEFVYFARPDSILLGKRVNEVRKEFGVRLARQYKIKADVVIPVPDSAVPAALGYAKESGIPFDLGLIKNRYIHRTFIKPAQILRESDVAMKLNPILEIVKGKNVIAIDDSIVRGTTSKKLVKMLQKAGAKSVHLLISSSPVIYPDFYGIDIPNQDDLIAFKMKREEIRKYLGADTLGYLDYRQMVEATGLPESSLSTSCFSGIYPADIGERKRSVKRVRMVK